MFSLWGYAGIARAAVDVGLSDSEALCSVGALTGQLNLKRLQAKWFWGSMHRGRKIVAQGR